MARGRFGATGFMIRWIVAVVLVFATYNPTGYSYVHWVMGDIGGEGGWPIKVLVGIVLAILYIVYFNATFNSIGIVGMVIVILFFAALLWVLDYWNWINLTEPGTIVWVLLIVFATVLAIGVSWSFIHRRITGQVDIADQDIHTH